MDPGRAGEPDGMAKAIRGYGGNRNQRAQGYSTAKLLTAMSKRTKPEGAYIGSESNFQKSAIRLVRSLAPCDPRLVAHIPNGGQRTIMAGARLKAEGVVKGYPDIMVFHAESVQRMAGRDGWGNRYCGLAIELKVWPNKPSPEQEELHALLESQGWRVVVCYGLGEVEHITREYFGNVIKTRAA